MMPNVRVEGRARMVEQISRTIDIIIQFQELSLGPTESFSSNLFSGRCKISQLSSTPV